MNRPMVTGTVRIELPSKLKECAEDNSMVRRRLGHLDLVPDGVTLALVVGDHLPTWEAVWLLLPHVDRLHIDVQGDAMAVRSWLDTLKSGEIAGVKV